MFFKIVVLKNFAIFTGKHLCWSRPATLSKRNSYTGVFYRTPPVAASERPMGDFFAA